jgi:hypothetical protein
MKRNPIIVSYAANLPTSWAALAATETFATVDVIVPSSNSAAVQIRVDGGTAANIGPGVAFTLERVDLSRVEVQGASSGQSLTVGGNSA